MTRTLVKAAHDRPKPGEGEIDRDPGDLLDLRCDTHPDRVYTSVTAQRARLFGWVVWDGTTVAGTEQSRTLCPACTGRGEGQIPDDPDSPFGFNAECNLCSSSMWEEWGVEDMPPGGWGPADARGWVDEHDCEPILEIVAPDGRRSIA